MQSERNCRDHIFVNGRLVGGFGDNPKWESKGSLTTLEDPPEKLNSKFKNSLIYRSNVSAMTQDTGCNL